MAQRRKVKIVATLGPASTSQAVLESMVSAGLDLARLNCSHSSHDDLAAMAQLVRRTSRALERPVGLLLDLCGPKVRTGTLEGGSMELVAGNGLRVVPGDGSGKDDWITCNHEGLASDVAVGHRILLDDGESESISFRADRVDRVDGQL